MLPAQPNQTLIEGIAVLQALAVSATPIGSREMARMLGLEPTRVNRLLRTLAHLGLARQTAQRKYMPGPAMHVLSAQSLFGSGLMRNALKPLSELSPLDMTVALGVLWRDKVCYLYHAAPRMSPAQAIGRVGLYPASRSSIGLTLLAQHQDSAIETLYADAPPEGYDHVDELLTALGTIRNQGYAWLEIEKEPSVGSLGVPLDLNSQSAVALSGAISKIDIAQYLSVLRHTADEINALNAADSEFRKEK